MFINTSSGVTVRPNIDVIFDESNPEFLKQEFLIKIQSSLTDLQSTPSGSRLIQKIGSAAHKIFIKQAPNSACHHVNEDKYIRGKGCSSVIFYNHCNSRYLSTECTSVSRPAFVDLAHELIHAYHAAVGKTEPNSAARSDRLCWTNDEEYRTIMGFPSKKTERTTAKVTENAILAEIGLPERFGHRHESAVAKTPIVQERMQLLTQLYRRFLETTINEGPKTRAPPPIINCTHQDLSPSKRLLLFYSYRIIENNAPLSTILIDLGDDPSMRDDFVKFEFDVNQCPEVLEINNIFPELGNAAAQAIVLYRLSCREADALDRGE